MTDAKGKGKARQEPPVNEPENPQLIRITNHGKITTWVAFALDFLDKHEFIPVVFHTLPATPRPTAENIEGATANPPSLSHTASTVPRLISVVEIVKREYMKKLELEHSSTLTGLYQYNEIGTLEDLGLNIPDPGPPQDADSARSQAIVAALQGKNHLKTKQTPFMKITLSRVQLPELETTATCQPPLERKLSKSAKARAKKREKNEAGVTDQGAMAIDVV
ncbi:hypothetical protein C8F04DRAFT_1222005 [Mycena alexandri]|uniref:Uncharacterized protein n=1 Tax=Mycena alexandri TaxID=1745969 RepID=A0AAD6SQ90_9AGAR|nr:hypothetical protein C8F04DRAFT_1222005 [Mycena alexandri]